MENDYPDLEQSGIEVIDNYKTELYYLFAISTYQVGALSSTAIFEGLYFGLQTFIYSKKAVSFCCRFVNRDLPVLLVRRKNCIG